MKNAKIFIENCFNGLIMGLSIETFKSCVENMICTSVILQ